MIIHYGGTGTYSEDGNGGDIWRRNAQDGHGGHSAEHRAEMEEIAERIAQQKIMEMIPEIQKAAYISAYNDIVGALSFDVTSAVRIGLETCGEIFYDSKTQQVLADAVMRELRKGLSGITF